MNARDELGKLISSRHTMAAADAILAAGYRKPRTITMAEELDALPVGSVIRDVRFGKVFIRSNDGENEGEDWEMDGEIWTSDHVDFPATVLYEPQP